MANDISFSVKFVQYFTHCCGNAFDWIDKRVPLHCPNCGKELGSLRTSEVHQEDKVKATLVLHYSQER